MLSLAKKSPSGASQLCVKAAARGLYASQQRSAAQGASSSQWRHGAEGHSLQTTVGATARPQATVQTQSQCYRNTRCRPLSVFMDENTKRQKHPLGSLLAFQIVDKCFKHSGKWSSFKCEIRGCLGKLAFWFWPLCSEIESCSFAYIKPDYVSDSTVLQQSWLHWRRITLSAGKKLDRFRGHKLIRPNKNRTLRK